MNGAKLGSRMTCTKFAMLSVLIVTLLLPLGIRAATIDEQIAANEKTIQNYQKIISNPSEFGVNAAEVQALKTDIGSLNTKNAQLKASKLKNLTITILDKANKMCTPVVAECGCGFEIGPLGGCVVSKNKYLCPCYDNPPPNHTVLGKCMAELECRGESFSGLDSKMQGVGDIGGIVGQIFKGILDKVMGGGGGGGGGGTPTNQQTGCVQYYQVTVPSTDPCAIYVPPTSSSLLESINSNASTQLLDALNSPGQQSTTLDGGTQTSVSTKLLSQLQEPTGTNTQNTESPSILSNEVKQSTSSLASGTRGDIEVTGGRATIFAGSRDAQGNTETVGFYGADTLGSSQPQTLVARMCEKRPWAESLVSYVIPPSFFDGLCSWRGYAVGPQGVVTAPSPTPIISVQQNPLITPVVTTPVSTIKPEVDIWALPEKVPLGARTSIFWTSKGASPCSVTSSAGNFSEQTLSGGAATVPITGTTIFTISCLAPDGTSISDTETVNLSI